jgi:hypothetical protein
VCDAADGYCGVGVACRLVKDGVHLLVKTQDGDVRRRGNLLGARRLGGQLLVTDVLCLLWWTVCHVGGASSSCRSTDKGLYVRGNQLKGMHRHGRAEADSAGGGATPEESAAGVEMLAG